MQVKDNPCSGIFYAVFVRNTEYTAHINLMPIFNLFFYWKAKLFNFFLSRANFVKENLI